MVTVTYAQLNAWLTAVLWPFVRILALVATAPLVGNAAVPARVKIGLSAFVAIAVAPALGPLPQATVFSAEGIWVLVNQFLIGAALGFVMQLMFAAVEGAGDFIGLQMGLGFATFFDPHAGTTPMMGRVLNAFAMLAFVALDGHLQLIAVLVESFASLPVSADLLHPRGWQMLADAGITVFAMGLLLALPVMAALLIANLALGILNRAAPQIGIFQVGFPVLMLLGLLLVQLMVPNMIPFFSRLFDHGYEMMGRVAASFR